VFADAASSRRKLSMDREWFSSEGSSSTASTTVSHARTARLVNVPVRVVTDTAFAEPDGARIPSHSAKMRS